jgi:hypothetical protein
MLQGIGEKDETWRWHAMNILIFCKIHFGRTVTKLIPENKDPNDTSFRDARDRLLSLTTCESREDYMKLTALIKGILLVLY